MKNLKSLVLTLALAFVFTFSANAKTESLELNTNMHCGACKTKIENSLKTMDGIEKSNVNLETKMVKLSYNSEKVSKDNIVKTIADLGFKADEVTARVENKDAKSYSTKDMKSCSTSENKDAKSYSTSENKDMKSCSTSEKKDSKACCTDKSKK